jgi:sugar/nucleoside kinase (ribokinase family)
LLGYQTSGKINLMMEKIVVVGDVSTDHFVILDDQDASLAIKNHKKELCLDYGAKIAVDQTQKLFGGSALNVSTSLGSLGKQVHIASIVGKDFSGREAIEFLNSHNVNTDAVEVRGETNQSFIIIYKNERTVLSYHKKRDYSKLSIPKSDLIYFASAGKGSEVLVNKIRAAIGSGAKLIFNPGSYELSNFELFKPLLQLTSIFIINRSEANLIIEDTPKITVQLDKILTSGTKVAVITDAKNGAYFATSQGHFHMAAAPAKIVDSTGAGDAFAAGLITHIMNGKSLEESAIAGMYNSASVIEEIGANTNLLNMAQIDKLVKENKILKFSPVH